MNWLKRFIDFFNKQDFSEELTKKLMCDDHNYYDVEIPCKECQKMDALND